MVKINVSQIVLIVLVLVVLGYFVYTKFINPPYVGHWDDVLSPIQTN